MKNEPVAWINRDEYHGWLNWDKNTEMPINIPLYTHPVEKQDESFDRTASHMAGEYVAHPVKELTNEKILEVIKELEHSICFSEGLGFFELKEFAEAILKRAFEK